MEASLNGFIKPADFNMLLERKKANGRQKKWPGGNAIVFQGLTFLYIIMCNNIVCQLSIHPSLFCMTEVFLLYFL